MKSLAPVLVAVTLAASACGSGRPAASTGLHSAAYRALPQALRAYIRSMLAKPNDGPTHTIDVYGPGTHAALEQAAMGDIVNDPEQTKDFYLVVRRGRFVCRGCSSPLGANAPHGTIETSVWSAQRGATDGGIGSRLPAAMSHLHPIAVITLSPAT